MSNHYIVFPAPTRSGVDKQKNKTKTCLVCRRKYFNPYEKESFFSHKEIIKIKISAFSSWFQKRAGIRLWHSLEIFPIFSRFSCLNLCKDVINKQCKEQDDTIDKTIKISRETVKGKDRTPSSGGKEEDLRQQENEQKNMNPQNVDKEVDGQQSDQISILQVW